MMWIIYGWFNKLGLQFLYGNRNLVTSVSVALELKCVVESNIMILSWCCITHHFHFKSQL